MAELNERVALNTLLDFYGPLLTEHRQEVVRLYCEEDLTQQEIADQLGITRQGVFDTLNKARRQLTQYERKLNLVARYRAQAALAKACLQSLSELKLDAQGEAVLGQARVALERIAQDQPLQDEVKEGEPRGV